LLGSGYRAFTIIDSIKSNTKPFVSEKFPSL